MLKNNSTGSHSSRLLADVDQDGLTARWMHDGEPDLSASEHDASSPTKPLKASQSRQQDVGLLGRVMRPTCEDSVGMSSASVPPTALSYAYPLSQNDVDDLLVFLAPTLMAPNLQPNSFDVAVLGDLQGLEYSSTSSSACPPRLCLI